MPQLPSTWLYNTSETPLPPLIIDLTSGHFVPFKVNSISTCRKIEQTDIHTYIHTGIHIDRQTDIHTDIQTNRQTDRQKDI